jgi:tetratricopeptide (TPR) repeat protein
MKKNNIYLSAVIALSSLAFVSCDTFLDEMPDNRAEIDSEDKIAAILVSAYTNNDHLVLAEFASDNVDDYGENNPYTDRFINDTYSWKAETEGDNNSCENFWDGSLNANANANEALAGIARIEAELPSGAALPAKVAESKGEALIARAYNNFMLANMFCMPYSAQTAEKELGLPYLKEPETQLMPQYKRGNLADLYANIEKDIEEGLEVIGDSHLTVPKYHWNKAAAYAFACRFYLYYGKYDKAIECANEVLGPNPKNMLRDWAAYNAVTNDYDARCNEYISAESNCNLVLATSYSSIGLAFGPYRVWTRYSHGNYVASKETIYSTNYIWGSYTQFRSLPKVYTATNLDRIIWWKVPYKFEYTDPVAGIGYRKAVYPLITTDETILNRAEAYALLGQYDLAAADLTTWMQSITKSTKTLTPDDIKAYYDGIAYSYDTEGAERGMESTHKKHLNPVFTTIEEGSMTEAMIHCVLDFRRIETVGQGMRWFDIRRYGIVIPRRVMNAAGKPEKITDWLETNDLRRCFQIPSKVLSAGFEANPR